MAQYDSPVCLRCKHYRPDNNIMKCAAFPRGIPFPILSSENDHREPFPGDHGIQFEPKEGANNEG